MRGLIRVKFNGLNARLVINGLIENGVYLKNLKERSKSVSFEIYEKDTYPLIERYRSRGVLVEIDANMAPDERLAIALKVINEHLN